MQNPWLGLFRLNNALIAGAGVALGHLCLPGAVQIGPLVLGVLSLAVLDMAGNIQNDVFDQQTDAVNRPDRAVAAGLVSPEAARGLATLMYVASVSLALGIGLSHGVLVIGMALLLYGYNRALKGMPLAGNFAVSLLCAIALYFSEYPGIPYYTLLPALFAFTTTMAREIVKDIEDMPGDSAAGMETLPIRYGVGTAKRWLWGFLGVTLVLLPWGWWVFPNRVAYTVVVLVAVLPALGRVGAYVARRDPVWGGAQRWMKWVMLAGMGAIGVGVV